MNDFEYEELNFPALIADRARDAERLVIFINMENIALPKNIAMTVKPMKIQQISNNLSCKNPLINFEVFPYK